MPKATKACVIIGAGASADAWNPSADILNAHLKPPLAMQLFQVVSDRPGTLRSRAYSDILNRYKGARFLAGDLIRKSRDSEALETALQNIADHEDQQMRERFREVPGYIRDLIWACTRPGGTNGYVTTPGTHNQLVSRLVADYQHEVLFLVLNYDTYVEQALSGYDPSMTYRHIGDYIAHRHLVVKLHGSVNWFKRLSGSGDWFEQIHTNNVLSKANEADFEITDGIVDISIYDSAPYRYPILTVPLAGKGDDAWVCPASHVEAAKDFLRDCRKFLIIGTSGLDADLFAVLNQALPSGESFRVHLVGMGDKVKVVTKRFTDNVDAFGEALASDRLSLHETGSGFKDYATGLELDAFAS